MKSHFVNCLHLPLVAAAIAVGVHSASAVTLLSDNFSSGTLGTQPAGWYANNTSPVGVAPLLVTDNTAPLSGNAMSFTGASSSSVMITSFATTTLAATGDFITLTVDMHSPTSAATAPYIGLYNDMGTPFTANLNGATGTEGDDTGFAMQKTLDTGTSDFKIYEQTAQGFPHGYTGIINTSSSGITASNTAGYSMTLTMTRNASSGLDISTSFGGYSTTFTEASPTTFTFNEVFLMNGLINGGTHNFDNVLVTSNVPEPTTMMLLGLGLTTAMVLRRRRVA